MTLPLPKDRFVAAETFEKAESLERKKEKEREAGGKAKGWRGAVRERYVN